MEGSIIVSNRKMADLFLELKEKGFTPFPKKKNAAEVAVAGSTDDTEESEENAESPISQGVSASDYDYLMSMAIGTLTVEKMKELRDERDKVMKDLEDLKRSSVKSLWMKDLDALEANTDDAISFTEMETEESQLPTKNKEPSRRAAAPGKTSSSASGDNDDIEPEEGREPAKGKAAAKPPVEPVSPRARSLRPRTQVPHFSDDSEKDSDDNFDSEADDPEFAPGPKKRGPASKQSQLLGQKLISEVLKPVDNAPEKKVRKMRDSPFNKKSGSILGRAMNVEEEGEETSAEIEPVAPRARSQRQRTQVTYVISDESENDSADNFDSEAEADNDSDFADDD